MDHDTDSNNGPLAEKSTLLDPMGDVLVAEEAGRWDFLILTVPFFGLQLTWTVQQVFGVPYLSSLRVPETQLPIFVLSGPLAGLIGPPIVAVLSERCQSPWGKRKPFILLGGLGTILSLLLLASAQPLALTLTWTLGLTSHNAATTTSHIFAGLSIYALNFSIQPLQLGLRASVIDRFSPHQQPMANLCISLFSALGSVFVALVGLGYSPAFWDISIVVTSVLGVLLGVVAFTKTSNHGSPPSGGGKDGGGISLRAHVYRLLGNAWRLPPITRRTCRVQLVSWFAWFLVLNYTSALVSRIYDDKLDVSHIQGAKPPPTAPPSESANAVSRVALLFHSAALATLVILSILWRRSSAGTNKADYAKIQLGSDVDADHEPEPGPYYDSDSESGTSGTSSALARTRDLLTRRIWKPSLAALAASLVGTCVLAAVAPFPPAATALSLLLGANGVLFALANWVPYALIAHEASAQARSRGVAKVEGGVEDEGDEDDGDDGDDHEDDTPRLLAVHNMAITVPQLVASLASWLLMQALAVLGLEGDVVWIFVICIPCALWAACL